MTRPKLLYRYHPLFRADCDALEIIGVRSDMFVTRLPDGTHRGVPAWMFDAEVCASIRNAPQPPDPRSHPRSLGRNPPHHCTGQGAS